MKLNEITLDHVVKIGKTSITVKNKNGKTAGIITNCLSFSELQKQPRRLFDTHTILKNKTGLSNTIDLITDCVLCDNDIYYLNDNSQNIFYEKYGFCSDAEKISFDQKQELKNIALSAGIPVIECIIKQ